MLGIDPHGFRTVMHRTQPEGTRSGPGDTDRTLHSLRRFIRLAASGNPSILMALWAPVLYATDEGRELIAEHGYDTKYAMHSARLGFQGVELLTTRRLQLPIAGEPADWLRAVRRGEVRFDDWWERCLSLDARLDEMSRDESLPQGPDRVRIEIWSAATHLARWRF